jgi:hypothetical protein
VNLFFYFLTHWGNSFFPLGNVCFSGLPEEVHMNKDDRKSFYRFVDSATNLELEAKLIQLHNLILKLKESSTIAEANWMIKEISLEMDARKDIHA